MYEALIADGWTICAKEICAGSAHWTLAFQKAGFKGDADDILYDTAQDLTCEKYVCQIMYDASCKRFLVSHCGTECTTFSTAAHPPYRDRVSSNVDGLPDVLADPDEGPKVRSANKQAENTARLLLHFAKVGIYASLENPANSMLWTWLEYHGWLPLLLAAGYRLHKTHYCHYKTRYQKATKVLCNYSMPEFPCCGKTTHDEILRGSKKLASGRWAARTKLANPYPRGLCQDWVRSVLAAVAAHRGVV